MMAAGRNPNAGVRQGMSRYSHIKRIPFNGKTKGAVVPKLTGSD
jgi:hypothetical protein